MREARTHPAQHAPQRARRRLGDTVAQVVSDGAQWQAEPRDVADVLAAEEWARRRASELVGLV